MNDWFSANILTIHPQKTYYMINFPKRNVIEEFNGKVIINGHPLQRIGESEKIKSMKFVGVLIDEKMTWKYHLENVSQKVANGLRCLVQCKKLLPTPVKILIYNGLVRPHLEYGICVWGSAKGTKMSTLVTLQKKAIRAISDAKYNSHSTPLFSKLGILKINHLLQVNACKLVEKVIRKEVPEELATLFSLIRLTRQTRHSVKPQVETNAREGPLSELAKLWNLEERKMAGASVKTYKRALIRDYMWQYKTYTCYTRNCYSCQQQKR